MTENRNEQPQRTLADSTKKGELRSFLVRQLTSFYGVSDRELSLVDKHLDEAIHRTLVCFSHVKNKYYRADDIRPLHTGQYTTFLYFLSNTIYRNELKETAANGELGPIARDICDKLYCLNKLTSCCELYYEIELPEFFFLDHPFASGIGRAKIGNGFFFLQGCTVGGNGGHYPHIGEYVFMFSNSKILGNCHIGNHVLIGANTYIKDMDIPDNSIVFGQYPNNVIKTEHTELIMKKIGEQFHI